MFRNRWFNISAISGILCFVLSPLGIEYEIEGTNITLLWSLIFPVLVSLAYGKRGAIVSSIFGGMWFPALLWPENGFGLIPNIIDYAIFYLLIGYIADKTKGKGSSFKEILLPIVFFIVFVIFSLLFVFKWVLSLSGNDISYWVASVIIIKDFFYFVFIIILSETLIRTNIIRKFLHLEINIYGKNNLKLIAYSFLSSFIIWLSFYLLDKLLMPSNTEKQYLGLLFMVLIYGSSIISRWLIYSSEKQLKAEIAQKESEERFRTLFTRATDGVILHSPDLRIGITHSNEAAYKILGYNSSDSIIGKNITEISPEYQEDGTKTTEIAKLHIQECLEKGQARFNWIHLKNDKTYLYLDVVLTKISFLNETYIHSVWRDVSEIREAQNALKKSEEKYRSFFMNSTDAMFILKDDKFIDCNPAAVKMLKYQNVSDVTNLRPDEISPEYQPDGRKSFEKAMKAMQKAFEKGSNRFEWEHNVKMVNYSQLKCRSPQWTITVRNSYIQYCLIYQTEKKQK